MILHSVLLPGQGIRRHRRGLLSPRSPGQSQCGRGAACLPQVWLLGLQRPEALGAQLPSPEALEGSCHREGFPDPRPSFFFHEVTPNPR